MLQSGTRLGAYEVTSSLGAGGMGEVYRAKDPRLKRDVALKVLRSDTAGDPDRLARLRREAELLASLNHPNIAQIYGLEESNGTTALVMELVEGDDLSRRLSRSAMPMKEALRIADQIAAALDAAHERGIVHRDLKPANIKLRSDGTVKVLDFGLAKTLDADSASSNPHVQSTMMVSEPMTQPGIVVGTVAYMSPEQARGLPLDRRTDIWSFGCVLYEMLAGRPLFPKGNPSDTIAAVLTADIDLSALPPDVPPGVRTLVSRCLERSTKDRLRDIADGRPYLTSESGSQQSVATSHLAPVSPPSGVSRRGLLVGGTALGLLGAAGVGSFVARQPQATPTPTFQRLTFRRGMIRTARFGPDFRTVLYGALWDGGVCRAYSVRPDSPESSPLPLPPAAPLAVSSAGELALSLGTHLRGIMPYGTLARVPLAGGAPRELQEQVRYADWSPDGRDLAIVRQVGARDQLEFPLGKVVATPEADDGGFSFLRVSPRGDAVAMFELTSRLNLLGKVVVVDRDGTRRAVSPRRYFNVFGLAWKGEEVWFTAADALPLYRNALYAMDMSGAVRIVTRFPSNTSLHDIAPDGRVLLANTDDRGGMAVRAPGASAEADLSWLDASSIADISPDGRHVLFTESGVGGGANLSTYLRGTDGSPAIRLGDGFGESMSPDGRWALTRTALEHIDMVPTGPGQPTRIQRPGMGFLGSRWLPDGRQLLVRARPTDGATALYVIDVQGSGTRQITPQGMSVGESWALSPDGRDAAVSGADGVNLFPLGSGTTRHVPGTTRQSIVLAWITSGLLVSEDPIGSGLVSRVDPVTGRRDTWAEIEPQDPVGIMNLDLSDLVVTPDGRSYGYHWHRALADLYLAEGWS